jgi:hypothetical protein
MVLLIRTWGFSAKLEAAPTSAAPVPDRARPPGRAVRPSGQAGAASSRGAGASPLARYQ